MNVLWWMISQLLSYSILSWAAFIAIAFFAALYLGRPGVVLGHIMVAVIVAGLDYRWIQSEMAKPGWNGLPDMDAVFFAGVLIRVVLINTVLLPISILALWWQRVDHHPRRVGSALSRRAG